MSSFILFGDRDGHTEVPNIFLDEYMPAANGEYVKIYLYLLRMLGTGSHELSVSLIADKFDRTEGDVNRALKYWEKMHLLRLEYDDKSRLTGVRLTAEKPEPAEISEKAAKLPEKPEVPPERTAKLSENPAELSENPTELSENPCVTPSGLSENDIRQLIFVCEQYLGRPLSPTETEKLTNIHDSLGFSKELIEYLVEYCVSGGHKSMRYIEATAEGWHSSGISTVKEAREKAGIFGRSYYRILKSFGISGRGPAPSETKYMDRWLKEDRCDPELICEACSRTVAAIGRPSFAYADKILSSWKEAGVTGMDSLKKYDAAKSAEKAAAASKKPAGNGAAASNRFHNFSERDYDYAKLEQALVNKP